MGFRHEFITQPLTLGIDTGRENIGLGVSNEKGECLYLANVLTYPQASPWDSLFLLKPNGFT